MNARDIIIAAERAGVELRADGGDLVVRGPKSALAADLVSELRKNKSEILATLGRQPVAGTVGSPPVTAAPTTADAGDIGWLRRLIETGAADRLERFHLYPWILVIHPERFARSMLLDLDSRSYRGRTGLAARDLRRFREVVEGGAGTQSPAEERAPATLAARTVEEEEAK